MGDVAEWIEDRGNILSRAIWNVGYAKNTGVIVAAVIATPILGWIEVRIRTQVSIRQELAYHISVAVSCRGIACQTQLSTIILAREMQFPQNAKQLIFHDDRKPSLDQHPLHGFVEFHVSDT
ncbi:hypothetical protein CF98_33660 [Halopseudomonas bauzanensis]|nr:hypothetical protein CF98_33660 [Halopseudomonas bauzanensis]